MLDLSMFTTEECVYPMCEGGFMCAPTQRCVARRAIVSNRSFVCNVSCRDAVSRHRNSGFEDESA
jgi:hypothetical protein